MKRLVLAVALVAGFAFGLGLAAVPAQADEATIFVRVVPERGTTAQAIELDLPDGAFCPAEADRVIARLEGGNLSAALNVTGNTAIRALDTKAKPGTAILPLLWTLQTTGGKVSPPVVLDGDFRLTVSCLAGLSQESVGDSIADISINAAAGTYSVTSPIPAAAPAPAQEGGSAQEPVEGANSPAAAAEHSASQPDSSQTDSEHPQEPRESGGAAIPQVQDSGTEGTTTPAPGSPDEAALAALAASNASSTSAAAGGNSVIQPLLIGAGLFLLVSVGLLARRARRKA